jgi:hypothetical protein
VWGYLIGNKVQPENTMVHRSVPSTLAVFRMYRFYSGTDRLGFLEDVETGDVDLTIWLEVSLSYIRSKVAAESSPQDCRLVLSLPKRLCWILPCLSVGHRDRLASPSLNVRSYIYELAALAALLSPPPLAHFVLA